MTNFPWRPAALFLAAICFVAYPALRGYSDESGLSGAHAYARPEWLYSHVFAMLGFVLLAYGLSQLVPRAAVAAWIGTILVLPYYGAEAFGLHALGKQVLETGHVDMIAAADEFRFEPVAVTLFALGWLAFSVAGILLLPAVAASDGWFSRAGLSLVALGLLVFLPQFFFPPAGRILHGVVLAIGLILVAASAFTGDSTRRASDVPLSE